MSAEVTWGGVWEHPSCGATGEAVWDDEDTARSGHDCGREGEIVGSAEWRCHGCGAGGDSLLEDDAATYSVHDCHDEDEEGVTP